MATVGILVVVRYADDLEQLGEEALLEVAQGAGVPLDSLQVGASGAAIGDVVRVVQGAAAFRGVSSREEAQAIADRLAKNASELNLSREEIRASLLALVPENAPWADQANAIVDQALEGLPQAPDTLTPPPETVQGGQRVLEPALSGFGIDSLALDSIGALNRQLAQERDARSEAEAEARATRQALEEAESRGFLSWLYEIIDDLGLGFGWGALYLTITHAWWKGTSVGKRLFRIRVVMIDQRPLNWWLSFERAGGYAAGFATGLLGFAQIFWDPNRQAIHDKVSETIVIQDGQPAVPGPWIEEGRAMWVRRRAEPPGA